MRVAQLTVTPCIGLHTRTSKLSEQQKRSYVNSDDGIHASTFGKQQIAREMVRF